ncbi:putative porin [Pontibacter litorisediminis]|uniref:putative porin n=1 Tax=Pontibacter litorisediminis TaxID=1846260 RepID=UPI0023ED4E6F|nr:putative porin [Pontibacter litorisediminis]
MKRKLSVFILLLLSLLLVNTESYAQIIDDTTKMLYGPKTVLKLYEQDVLMGRYTATPIDTSLNNHHNERYWYNDTSFYQHLGNIGTAATPMLFQLPDKIGVRLGKNIFDRYAYDPQKVTYYNTRSPYTYLDYVQGGRGEIAFEALHTRNINERWNFGVAYQILSADQQIGPAARRRQTRDFIDNQAIKAFTHYRSKNEKYDLFFNYTFMKVEQVETGGIDTTARGEIELRAYEEAPVYLNQALNEESRNNLHLTHIYRLAQENLKVYHTFDYYRQRNAYLDDAIPTTTDRVGDRDTTVARATYLYPTFKYSYGRTNDATEYKELENTFGLTGNNKLSSYKAYVKLRNANIMYSAIDSIDTANNIPDSVLTRGNVFKTISASGGYDQVFLGGDIRFFYKDLAEITGSAEYQLAGDYRIKGTARLGGAYGTLQRVLYSPSRVQDYMLGNHYSWSKDFGNIVVDRIGAGLHQKIGKRQYLKLDGHYTNVKRWVYFNEAAVPVQASGSQRFWGGSISHKINFGPLYFDNLVVYTNTDEANNIPMPEWLVESKVYVQGPLFKNALFVQLGVQGNYASEYYGYGYMPVTQQFYVQNDFLVQGYPVAEVFMNADIKTVNVFLKMSHVNQGLSDPVYFQTPLYPGLRRSFVFGVMWRFFD